MSVWKKQFTLASINATSKNTLVEHLNIKYEDFDDNSLTASMPVKSITHQPLGMLHGGASVVLIETLASLAANLCVQKEEYCVGLEVNANHIRSVRQGILTATAVPLHIGGRTHVWQVKIVNEQQSLICIGRLTVAVMSKNKG